MQRYNDLFVVTKFFMGFFIEGGIFWSKMQGPGMGQSQVEAQGGAERAAMAALQEVVLD